MTTFLFTQAISAVNSKVNQIHNVFSNSIVGQYIEYQHDTKTSWKSDKITGKLSELSIQTSTYNKIIPIVYGTQKLAGNIIWLSEVKEIVNNNTITLRIGKGQKIHQNAIEYFYYLSFAVAICKGEIAKLKNTWADGKLLDLTKYTHRFYSGTEEQIPDVLIESIEGSGKVTAYRGISYIVFENFPLSEFNNRIPNFIFEVERKNNIQNNESEFTMEKSIKGLNIMPNFGETLLHTELQYKAGEQFAWWLVDTVDGIWYPMNNNNNDKIADGLYCLNNMLETFPNCEWFMPHVAFFADNLDIANCTLKPRVVFNFFHTGYPIYTRSDRFTAGIKWDRYNTPLMGIENGKFRFASGTISNGSLLIFFKKLKENGKKVIFCPDILMDVENKPDFSLLNGKIEDIHNFFNRVDGYNEFILSYADILKDTVDAFLIGNDLSCLTTKQAENGSFPAVDELVELARKVKKILGENVKVGYSANFKEYHDYNGWHHLDKLWMCDAIDFVGIKAYFPLTYSPQDEITKDTIKNGWFSGEYYDYLLVNGEKIPIEEKDGCKNIKYWWENQHFNPDGAISEWIPKSKKIWFTEYGFCSIDSTTNQPYNKVGEKPVYSSGNVDFFAQKTAIEATEEAFDGNEYVENKLVYCWDARPYPFYPNRTDLWDDCEEWQFNYCLNGKTGISNANVVVHQLFIDAGIDIDLIEGVEVDDFIDGLIINNSMSINDVLYVLQKVYFFDCIEDDGKIKFISNKSNMRNKYEIIEINEDDLILNGDKYVMVDVVDNNNLPKRFDLIFIDKNNNYDSTSVYAEIENVESNKKDIETLPVVLDEEKARNVAKIFLQLSWLEKSIFTFNLPLKYLYLNASDLIKLNLDDKIYLLKVKTITVENNMLKVIATQFDNEIYNYEKRYSLNTDLEIIKDTGKTNLKLIELPAINNGMSNKIYLFFAVSSEFINWNGANIYYSSNNGRTYNLLNSIKQKSLIGTVFNIPRITRPYYFDYLNELNVFFHEGIDKTLLENIEDLELFTGANIALYGNEIIQFKNIVLQNDNSYKISGLLRGLYDTENEINNHREGDNFIILNNNLLMQDFSDDKINFYYNYKAVTFGKDLADAETIIYSIKGKNLKPFTPCHLKWTIMENKLLLKWNEKGRGYTNWVDYRDFVSLEKERIFRIEIKNENNVLLKKMEVFEENAEIDLNELDIDDNANLKIVVKQINEYGEGEESFIEINL